MCIVFSLGAISNFSLGYLGRSPTLFILLSDAVYFTWGAIYNLFPATCTDSFGTQYATTGAGMPCSSSWRLWTQSRP